VLDQTDLLGQLVKALPKMAEGASAEAVKAAFDSHLEETMQW
jgi:ferritin-like metal-binding protein YciE